MQPCFRVICARLREPFPAARRQLRVPSSSPWRNSRLTGLRATGRWIDVSGDGRANNGVHPMTLRDQAIELGVTVNGLAILNEEPFLDNYFEHGVIGGAGAFLMVADDYRDFAASILQKLLREIGIPVARNSYSDPQHAMVFPRRVRMFWPGLMAGH